jgi:2-keto-4-pentenoate hydratase
MTAPSADPRTATLDAATHERMAADLFRAWQDRAPIGPLSDEEPGMTMADGYAVQQGIVRRLLDAGDTIVGYKLGLTSKPMQEMLKVDSPDLAPVMSSHLLVDGSDIAVDRFITPRMEAEIAFILGADLGGPNVTANEVMRATISSAASRTGRSSSRTRWPIWPAAARSCCPATSSPSSVSTCGWWA